MNYDLNGLHELPVHAIGWSSADLDFTAGEEFWRKLADLPAEAGPAAWLDDALEGRSAPRVWLVVHEPGQGALSAAVALGLARELAVRQQATLVLDADENERALTRWAGREEAEGWIDMVRYGASVLTGGVAMPFAGRTGHLLGIGSFTPTDVTGQEIARLLARLRRQADDIVIVAQPDEVGRLWGSVAQIRLFCWDRAQRADGVVDALATTLATAGTPLTGLIGFGGADAAPAVADAASDEVAGAARDGELPDESEHEPDAEPVTEPAAEIAEEPESDERIEDEATVETEIEPTVPAGAAEPGPEDGERQLAADEQPDRPSDAIPDADPQWARRKSNSGVFWGAALVSLVLILAVSFYYVKYLRVPPEGNFGDTALQAGGGAGHPAPPPSPGQTVAHDAGQVSGQADEVAESADQPELTGEASVQDPAGEREGAGTMPDRTAAEAAAPTVEDHTVRDDPAPTPDTATELTEPTETTETATPPPAPVFDPAPYEQPVGQGGWALWVYSFADSTQARQQQDRLQRQGIRSVTRIVEIKDKGRYWRIFMGSFPSAKAATRAKPLLLEKLREDWAQPVRF